jgi:hypothetical protein
MSHHYSGPDYGFPHGDARLDLTDLYAFPKPGDPGKSILIMDVHPSVGVNPPGPTTDEPFAPHAVYELKIDTDGNRVADIAYRVRFSRPTRAGRRLPHCFAWKERRPQVQATAANGAGGACDGGRGLSLLRRMAQ